MLCLALIATCASTEVHVRPSCQPQHLNHTCGGAMPDHEATCSGCQLCACLGLALMTALTAAHARASVASEVTLQDHARHPKLARRRSQADVALCKKRVHCRAARLLPHASCFGDENVSDISSIPPALQAQAGDLEAPSDGSKSSAALCQGPTWRRPHAHQGWQARRREDRLKLWQGQGCQHEEQPQLRPQQGSRLRLRGTPKGALRHVSHHLHKQPEV